MVGVGAAPLYVKAPVAVMVELSGFVMTTGAAPAVPAGVVQVIVVAFVTVVFVQAFAPIFTVALVWKFVPAIVIAVPPAGGPLLGVTLVMVGVEPYVKAPPRDAVCVSGFVTVTVVFPAVPAEVTQLRVLPELKTATPLQAPPPMVTVAPVRKLVPEMTTSVPPAMGPEFGVILVSVRSGGR